MSNIPADVLKSIEESHEEISARVATLIFKALTSQISKSEVISKTLLEAVKNDDWVGIAAVAQTIDVMDRRESKAIYNRTMENLGLVKADPSLKFEVHKLPNITLSMLYGYMCKSKSDRFLVAMTNQVIEKAEVENEMILRGLTK